MSTVPVGGAHGSGRSPLGSCQDRAPASVRAVSWRTADPRPGRNISVHGARRIIIGTNGSPGSLQALRYAAGVAQENDATLVPVLAWLPPGGDLADRRHPSGYLRQVWRDAAWLRLWAALEKAWGGIAPAGRLAEPRGLRGGTGEGLVA